MKELYKLKKLQKGIAIKVVAAYRSVAIHSALILARILLLELQADLLQKMYLEKKKRMSEGINLEVEATHSRLLTEAMRWKIQLHKPGLSGKRVREAITPQLHSWMIRKHGDITYRMS